MKRAAEALITDRLHWAVALTPIVTILIFYSTIIHARLLIGEWPDKSNIDIRELTQVSISFALHYVITFIAIIMTSISPIAWLVLLSHAHLFESIKSYAIRFVLYVINLAFTLWIALMDPANYLSWFVD